MSKVLGPHDTDGLQPTYFLAAEILPTQLVFQLGPDLLASDSLQVNAMKNLVDVPGVQRLLVGGYWKGNRVSKGINSHL